MTATVGASGRARERADLLRTLDEAFHGPAWHGPSLRSALRGVPVAEALWTPAPGRNSIWELALHAAYTKHRVLRRLDAAQAARFPRTVRRGWWPRLPEPADAASWRADLALLDESHRRVCDAIAQLPAARLVVRRPGKRWTLGQEALGLAMHDVYHAGQVRLLRRLYAAAVDGE